MITDLIQWKRIDSGIVTKVLAKEGSLRIKAGDLPIHLLLRYRLMKGRQLQQISVHKGQDIGTVDQHIEIELLDVGEILFLENESEEPSLPVLKHHELQNSDPALIHGKKVHGFIAQVIQLYIFVPGFKASEHLQGNIVAVSKDDCAVSVGRFKIIPAKISHGLDDFVLTLTIPFQHFRSGIIDLVQPGIRENRTDHPDVLGFVHLINAQAFDGPAGVEGRSVKAEKSPHPLLKDGKIGASAFDPGPHAHQLNLSNPMGPLDDPFLSMESMTIGISQIAFQQLWEHVRKQLKAGAAKSDRFQSGFPTDRDQLTTVGFLPVPDPNVMDLSHPYSSCFEHSFITKQAQRAKGKFACDEQKQDDVVGVTAGGNMNHLSSCVLPYGCA